MADIRLPLKILNKVLEYLSKRPWKETNELILEIHKEVKKIEEPEKNFHTKTETDNTTSFSQMSFTRHKLN